MCCQPRMMVFAGPNGSGKSTLLSEFPPIGMYVNADEIKKQLHCDDEKAAKIAEETRERLFAQRNDFTFETVLSTDRNYNLMKRAKEAGYYVVCIYILTCNPEINVRRVDQRVKKGGHDVLVEKIVSRYCRALRIFPLIFGVCDEVYVFDNSLESTAEGGGPQRIVQQNATGFHVLPNAVWTVEMLQELLQGNFGKKFEEQ